MKERIHEFNSLITIAMVTIAPLSLLAVLAIFNTI